MVTDGRWKYIHHACHRPQLFDLRDDPDELEDLGGKEATADVRRRLEQALCDWLRQRRTRITLSNHQVAQRTGMAHQRGYLFGLW